MPDIRRLWPSARPYQVPNNSRILRPPFDRVDWGAACPKCLREARWSSTFGMMATSWTISCDACGDVTWQSVEAPTER